MMTLVPFGKIFTLLTVFALLPLSVGAKPYTIVSLQLNDEVLETQHDELLNGAESQLYTCSMHPEVRSEDPDEPCPICGMELIPADRAGGAEALGEVSFSDRSLALLQVQTEPAQLARGLKKLMVTGRIAYDPEVEKNISAWVGGRLEKLPITHSGQEVQAGDVVARIYSPELLVAQEELLQAARQRQANSPEFLRQSNQTTYRAARERLRLLGLTAQQIDDVIERGEAREHIEITAPVGGTVTTAEVREGDYVDTGDTLLRLANLTQVWAVLDFYETDLPFVELGQEVQLGLAAYPEHEFSGEVVSQAPAVDEQRRVREVRVALANEAGLLTPGALVRAELQLEQSESLLIPASAPLITGQRALVYVRDPEETQRFALREVELGHRLGDSYQVHSGLAAGELVVSRGAFRIDSELQIRGQASMMAPAGNGAAGHDHGDHNGHAEAGNGSGEEYNDHNGGHNGETAEHHDHAHHEHAAHGDQELPAYFHGLDVQDPLAAADLVPDELAPVFTHYLALWEALHSDDLAAWQDAAAEFFAAIEAINWPAELSELADTLNTGAGHAHHVKDLSQAREQFYHHSGGVIALAHAGLHQQELHLAFCPMARDNEGAYWLQPDRELLNPYFGDMMLRCGDMLEALAPGGEHVH